jgi:hypothetical protein
VELEGAPAGGVNSLGALQARSAAHADTPARRKTPRPEITP